MTGDDDGRETGNLLENGRCGFDAFERVSKHSVDNDNMRSKSFEAPEDLSTITGFLDFETVHPQESGKGFSHRHVVIDHENPSQRLSPRHPIDEIGEAK